MQQYTVLMVEGDCNLMVDFVKHFFDEGWVCQGGISVENRGWRPTRFYQAMVHA